MEQIVAGAAAWSCLRTRGGVYGGNSAFDLMALPGSVEAERSSGFGAKWVFAIAAR
jgi:hypothetical protein